MYKERSEDYTSWRDLFIQFLFVSLFIFILFWLFPTKSYLDEKIDSLYQSNFAENVERMSVASQHYFINPRLPQQYGETFKLTLQEMYELKIILPIVDERGNSCDPNRSYVEITKVDADHYLMKVYLSCPEMEDYIFVHLGCYDYCVADICEEAAPTKPIVTPKPIVKPKPIVVPIAPAISCSVQSMSQINLSWNKVANATSYTIYRCIGDSCTPTSQIHKQSGITWSNTGLNEGTTYRYRVKATNTAGASNYSNTVTCTTSTTPVQPKPQAPTVSCSTQSTSQIDVSWNGVNHATGYRVYRCIGSTCTPTSLIQTLSSTFWANTGLSEGITYRYRVKAYNAAGESNFSNIATCTTQTTPAQPVPQAPTVSCSTQSANQIDVSWNAVNYALGYKVFRCTGTSCIPTVEERNQVHTFWSNTGLNEGTTYLYQIKAYNAAGESNFSNIATCTTTQPVSYMYEYQKAEVTEETVWSGWSSWSTTSVSSTLLRQVETKDETVVETRREQVLIGYENKIVTETRRVKVGDSFTANIECLEWSRGSVTTRVFWQESSTSPRIFGYIPQDTSTTIYVLSSVPTDGYDCSSTNCVVKKGIYRVFERRTQTTTSGSDVCVRYAVNKQSVFGDRLVSYNVQSPIYGWVDKQYTSVVKYYRFRNGQVIKDTKFIIRWGDSPNDYALVSQGFVATGNKKVK